MADHTSTNSYFHRWHELLAEDEQLQIVASFTPPFSTQEKMQLNDSAARRQELTLKLNALVDEWAVAAGATAHE